MDPLFLAEVAAVATPTVATWRYAAGGRKRTRAALHEPLFWDGGQPVSLGTIFNALNGEGDLLGELAQLVGTKPPLTLPDLERAVALLQANLASARRLIAEVAANAVIQAPGSLPSIQATVEVLDRLAAAQESMGFYTFVASLNAERPAGVPALLPIDAVVAGGFPLGPPSDGGPPIGSPARAGGGVLGMLQSWGESKEFLPGMLRVVEDLARDRQVKKARDAYLEALTGLGKAVVEAMRRRSPAGDALRRNVYAPLDAYKNLATRLHARPAPAGGGMKGYLVPTVEVAFLTGMWGSLARATAVVSDQCANLERALNGRSGPALAGEIVYRHAAELLPGLAPGAFPIGAVDRARDAYRAMLDGRAPDAPA